MHMKFWGFAFGWFVFMKMVFWVVGKKTKKILIHDLILETHGVGQVQQFTMEM